MLEILINKLRLNGFGEIPIYHFQITAYNMRNIIRPSDEEWTPCGLMTSDREADFRHNLSHFFNSSRQSDKCIWVRSQNCVCLVTWFCYQLIAKPGNKTAAVSWPDPYAVVIYAVIYQFHSWFHCSLVHNHICTFPPGPCRCRCSGKDPGHIRSPLKQTNKMYNTSEANKWNTQ